MRTLPRALGVPGRGARRPRARSRHPRRAHGISAQAATEGRRMRSPVVSTHSAHPIQAGCRDDERNRPFRPIDARLTWRAGPFFSTLSALCSPALPALSLIPDGGVPLIVDPLPPTVRGGGRPTPLLTPLADPLKKRSGIIASATTYVYPVVRPLETLVASTARSAPPVSRYVCAGRRARHLFRCRACEVVHHD